jgi:hypothetical protein
VTDTASSPADPLSVSWARRWSTESAIRRTRTSSRRPGRIARQARSIAMARAMLRRGTTRVRPAPEARLTERAKPMGRAKPTERVVPTGRAKLTVRAAPMKVAAASGAAAARREGRTPATHSRIAVAAKS